jgi:hypothetical protein
MADNGPVLNPKELGRLASVLLSEIQKQKHSIGASVAAISKQADGLFDAAIKVGRSHSGSNFGYHGALYYGDFEVPQLGSMFNVEWGGIHGLDDGWKKREPDEVRNRIEKLAGVSFAAPEDAVKPDLDAAKRLHEEVLVKLAPLHKLPDGNRERLLLDSLEHFDWKDSAHRKYSASALKSFPNMTRDSAAATQGMMIPSHTYYEAVAAQVKDSCNAIEEFWRTTERLLRQLQSDATQELVGRPESLVGEASIAAKYERLKLGALLLGALVSSFLVAGAAELAIRKWQWRWLLDHPNSYAIQWLSYAVLLCFLIGLFVRKYRSYCWGFGLIPLLVAVLQSLGGPPHAP